MSNGVEVIVATDRSTRLGEPEFLRLLSSTVTRPITLAPHTLTNHMSMVLPTDYINEAENELVSSLNPANAFVTKTYYTTYTYLTTSIIDNKTEVSSKTTVISNIQTEEVTKSKTKESVKSTSAVDITLDASPTLQTEVYHTTYTYMNTILDGDQPLVLTSKHTVANTVVGVDDYFNQLEPSEVFPTTNTYLKTVEFTKTLTDGTDYQIISTKDVLTQVVVTDKPEKQTADQPSTTDVTKTYFVTYTYFSTYLDGDKTKVKSDVSVSSDVTVEKFFVKPKKTEMKNLEKNTRLENQNEITETMPFSILATKTYLTTFTYFTTLLQGAISEKPETKINSRTKVVHNIVTETLSPEELDSDSFKELKSSFDNNINNPIVTTAVLKGGEKIEITAFKGDVSDIVYEKLKIKPTKSYLNTKTDIDFNDIEAAENNLELTRTKLNTKPTPLLSKTKTTLLHKQKTKPIKTISNDITAEALVGLKQEETPSLTSIAQTPTSLPLIQTSNHKMDGSQSTPFDYSTSVLSSPTVTANGATLQPGEQVIVVRDENGQPSVIPVSDPAKKKEPISKNPNGTATNDILNLNPLGMNVLGPVFNAMAQLINNNLNSKPKDVISKRNDTVPMKKIPIIKKPTSTNTNPITNFGAAPTTIDPKSRPTTSRTPVYIPVGSFAGDSDFGESQDSPSVAVKNDWHDKYVDTQPKHNFEFEQKRPHDPSIAILESGIPISPGQIIRTNSDVIIGRPGALGPRPPNFALKNNYPADMKPPPLHPPLKIHDDVIGQHSTHQGVDPDIRKEEDFDMVPPPPPIKPIQEPHVYPIKPIPETHLYPVKPVKEPHVPSIKPVQEPHIHPPKPQKHNHPHSHGHSHNHHHNHYKIQSHKHKPDQHKHDQHKYDQHKYDQHKSDQHKNDQYKHDPHDDGSIDLNPPPLPPPPRPSMEIRPITINHQPHEIIPYKPTHIEGNILPIPVHLGPNENVDDYVNPAEFRPDALGLPSVPIVNNAHQERGQPSSEPTPSIHVVNPNNIHVLPNVVTSGPVIISQNPHIDRSTGHPLLVNIQPSQVANVVIPQGTTTALIISGQNEHSLKGQVIDDPSPHSEPEIVGLFGAEPVLKLENENLGLSNQNEVVPAGTEGGRPVVAANENRPVVSNEIVHIRPKPNYNDIGMKPPQYTPPSYPSQEIYKPHNPPYNHKPYPSQNHPSVAPPQKVPPPIYDPTLPYDDHNSLKVSNGIYVDVSPAGHLPPFETGNNIKLQPVNNFNNNYPNVQSHQEPLNVNVQVGYATNVDQNGNANGNNYIGIPTNHTHGHGDFNQYHDNTNYIKPPGDMVPENLSPPPPPKSHPSSRPVRPISSNHRYPSSHNPYSKPLEFMVPPPKLPHKPNYKPHPHQEVHIRPIPIGGSLDHSYPIPRPEDILIIPPNIRPENPYQNFNYPSQEGNAGDLEIGDANDPLETEDGEEIQESNSRPLLPGQLPTELEKLNQTQIKHPSTTEKVFESSKDTSKINADGQNNYGVNNDKTDFIDSRNQTKEVTKVPNFENEIKTENSKLNETAHTGNKEESDINMNEAEKIFGSKLPANDNNKPVLKPTRKPPKEDNDKSNDKEHSTASEINNILTPPKMPDAMKTPEEVMGLSPPPYERPRRPVRPSRPKPPYKFEIPTTPKTTNTPITMENDFPPVRSPEYTRKPIKPQDIFPPRLPDDFVHHVPDFPPVRTPKPRPETRYPVRNKDRPTVTSLPIDVPGSSTSENPISRPTDFIPNDTRESYFHNVPSAADINGHSKPVHTKEEPAIESMRPPPPPPPPTQSRPKPTISQRLPVIYPRPHPKPPQENRKPLGQILREQIRPSHINNEIYRTTHYSSSPTTPTYTSQTHKNWKEGDVIVGSETIFDPDKFNKLPTPTFKPSTERKNIVTSLVTTGSTTIFGDVYTVPLTLEPTKAKSTSTDLRKTVGYGLKENPEVKPSQTTPVYPTYTTTLTVTTTMTTVVHSIGQKPSTKTVVLTKTLISTIVDKVTEIKTLVQPTTATVTQTHTIATTKTTLVVPTAGYPSHPKYPTGATLKPEIFIEDPHAKDTMTISVSSYMNKNRKKPDIKQEPDNVIDQSENESILVVMTDKNPKYNYTGHRNHFNVGGDDTDEPNILLGGVLVPGGPKDYKDILRQNECLPECKATRNELCQKHEGTMKCVCRPGFARMFPDRPCKPTYTYNMKLTLEKLGGENIGFGNDLNEAGTPKFTRLASATKEGLDRMIMQSDLRDVYHGVIVNGFQPKKKKAMVDFHVQLSENTEESRLMDVFKKTLRTSNFSLGGTELFAAREADNLEAQDFNECSNTKFHDCSENARCFNLKGTYTCSCKEGFTDLSQNSAFPGRVCSDMIGCEYCGYHGTCYTRGDDQMTCECFQWYSGERCRINLKVLLIALVTIGAILLSLLLVCIVLTCLKRRSRSTNTSRANGSSGYLRYRGPPSQAMDKRAMIADSSSESSVENLPYINPPQQPTGTMSGKRKPVLRQHNKGPAPRPMEPPAIVPMEQRDRSVTVMIPRAKYRPIPPISPHLTMSTFAPDKHLSRTAAQISTEQKLLSYLEGNAREATLNHQNRNQNDQKIYDYKSSNTNLNDGPRSLEYKKDQRVFEYEYKTFNMNITDGNSSGDRRSSKHGDSTGRFRRHSDSTNLNSDHNSRSLQHRKYSTGALVSAGFEVSATVGLRHRDDDMLEEENSAILNTSTMKSNRSQFTTLNRTGDHKTMSEARSYDETTIHPPTRSLKTHYSGSSHSRVNNDEGHTMVERDLGSTFLMPESHLFKPDRDRGSDISNFDSL